MTAANHQATLPQPPATQDHADILRPMTLAHQLITEGDSSSTQVRAYPPGRAGSGQSKRLISPPTGTGRGRRPPHRARS